MLVLENSFTILLKRASLVTQMVKNLPAMLETWVQSLGWENPMEKGMATHSSILAWRIPMGKGIWQATVNGVAKSQTWLSDKAHIWRPAGKDPRIASWCGRKYPYMYTFWNGWSESISSQFFWWVSRVAGEKSTTSDMQMIPLWWQKMKRN